MKGLKLLFVMLFMCAITVKAQTKKETQDWMLFYLEKYFSTDYDADTKAAMVRINVGYKYDNYSYQFINDDLNVYANHVYVDSTDKINYKGSTTFIINLKRVINVERDSIIGSLYSKDMVRIVLNFSHPNFDKNSKVVEQSVKKFENNKDITDYTSYPTGYVILSYKRETIDSHIMYRMAKAFETIVNLSGGKVIKELF